MNQHWLFTAFFFALLLLLLYGAVLILSPFLKALIWAGVIAVLFYPVYAWLLRALGGRATAAALIITVMITLLVVLPGIRLANFLSNEAVDLVRTVGALTREGGESWEDIVWVQNLLSWWSLFGIELESFGLRFNWKEALLQGAKVSSGAVVTQVTGVAQNVLLFIGNFIVVLISLFFFLRDGAAFCYRLRKLLPMDQEHQERLFTNIVNATTAVIHGLLVVAMIQGFLSGIAYWLLGVPYPVVWGVVTAFVALFPIGGTTLVSVPVSIYLFLEGETVRGIILLIWSLGVVGTVDNILKPMFIGSRLKLPILFLFFGILGGLAVFGAVGLILGPVLFALLAALLDVYSEEYGQARVEKELPG